MSRDGNFDQDDAQQVEIEDVLDDLPWENQTAESENSENSYVQSLLERSDLKILQVDRVNRSFEQNGACGLFKVFISRSFLDKMRKWTNQCLKEDGMREANETKFNAYIGLELAMSLLQFNDLHEYWKNNMFQGHKDFKTTMSRDDFMRIRSHLKLRPPEYLYDSATNDPL
jgi:Transposase IS4